MIGKMDVDTTTGKKYHGYENTEQFLHITYEFMTGRFLTVFFSFMQEHCGYYVK